MLINFGSLNIDYVYQMEKIVSPGETLSSQKRSIFPGGKGLNQSVAAARAGMPVRHAGFVGKDDGNFLAELLAEAGVDTTLLQRVSEANGHAIIQVEASGENCILLYGGTNQMLDEAYVATVAQTIVPGDVVLFQNETSAIAEMMTAAKAKGAVIALNPSPIDDKCLALPLGLVDIFILNEHEGEALTGEKDPEAILDKMASVYPGAKVVLTLGGAGALCASGKARIAQKAIAAGPVIDTTAAGDTFAGYYLAGISQGLTDAEALLQASVASGICITREGAAPSIPTKAEVEAALGQI
ncbi:MAG: ribokinase [Eubacterium sp.]|nr:ribokinase [Eubacterium sp.]